MAECIRITIYHFIRTTSYIGCCLTGSGNSFTSNILARPSVSADQWFDIEYKWANNNGNEFIKTASNEDLSGLGKNALDQYNFYIF